MDIIIWIVLTILAVFFTLLVVTLEDMPSIYGFGLVISIIAMLVWILAGLAAIDLNETVVSYNVSSNAMEEYVRHFDNSWIITFVYLLLSIFPFLMILKKIPETWKIKEKE